MTIFFWLFPLLFLVVLLFTTQFHYLDFSTCLMNEYPRIYSSSPAGYNCSVFYAVSAVIFVSRFHLSASNM
ncbi:hypothetical protein F5878DRAFT_606563 [Lentinula raphanica]|uniref:Uncharacterized protein n=1 Tax=Lentinula raphanica TaxID=153919 RepID=A0AA38PH66_9AGAR|nr:hypothetical protein F5878DRAFT_606563 [Lentinula raphanica]